ncbi:MAG: MarR family winged helix-turn-helix transcriptional regulator [Candidatus Pacebacteria bacterium]|nr:MarR family winged helix-turn-helix transcriptional regulator [Candidatus Paceibacterota bacterium]
MLIIFIMESPITKMVMFLGMIDKDLERYVTNHVQGNGYPDMTRIRFAILRNIQMRGEVNQKMIAAMAGVTPQAIHRHIKFLEEKEYLKRKAAKDARSQEIYLTARGEKTLSSAFILAKEAMEKYFKNISQKEIESIITILKKVKELPKGL